MPTNLTPAELAEGLRRMNDPAATQYEVESWLLNHGEAALRELAALREQVAWRPIDEAPRDGSLILALIFGRVIPVRRHVVMEGWYAPLQECMVSPTHWQPLPEPPRGQA